MNRNMKFVSQDDFTILKLAAQSFYAWQKNTPAKSSDLAGVFFYRLSYACLSFRRRVRLSAIMAMNSEFVGLPLMFDTV